MYKTGIDEFIRHGRGGLLPPLPLNGTLDGESVPRFQYYPDWFIKFRLDWDSEKPRLLTRSWRKVCKSVLLAEVLVELPDELLVDTDLSAETRLLKSDFSVLRALSFEEVEDVDELSELVPNSDISCSNLLVKFE